MEIQCKFWEQGCEYLGPRLAMQDHLDVCSFRKIECQFWPCQEMVSSKKLVNHLKVDHDGVSEWPVDGYGRVHNFDWIWGSMVLQWSDMNAVASDMTSMPQIARFDGQTFILQNVIKNYAWKWWVTLLGDENEAKKYEVKMDVRRDGCLLNVSFWSKVYSTDNSKTYVLKDDKGILKLSQNQVRMLSKMKDATVWCMIKYQIIRKKQVM